MKEHHYQTIVKWTGNQSEGTKTYTSYSRNHVIQVSGKAEDIQASSDPSFKGDSSRYNPEELFLSSLSSCHMLWYLHLCSVHHIIVTEYTDEATGIMTETKNGSGKFTAVTLKPRVKVTDKSMIEKAIHLHHEANKMCFIANSCNIEIRHNPTVI